MYQTSLMSVVMLDSNVSELANLRPNVESPLSYQYELQRRDITKTWQYLDLVEYKHIHFNTVNSSLKSHELVRCVVTVRQLNFPAVTGVFSWRPASAVMGGYRTAGAGRCGLYKNADGLYYYNHPLCFWCLKVLKPTLGQCALYCSTSSCKDRNELTHKKIIFILKKRWVNLALHAKTYCHQVMVGLHQDK